MATFHPPDSRILPAGSDQSVPAAQGAMGFARGTLPGLRQMAHRLERYKMVMAFEWVIPSRYRPRDCYSLAFQRKHLQALTVDHTPLFGKTQMKHGLLCRGGEAENVFNNCCAAPAMFYPTMHTVWRGQTTENRLGSALQMTPGDRGRPCKLQPAHWR